MKLTTPKKKKSWQFFFSSYFLVVKIWLMKIMLLLLLLLIFFAHRKKTTTTTATLTCNKRKKKQFNSIFLSKLGNRNLTFSYVETSWKKIYSILVKSCTEKKASQNFIRHHVCFFLYYFNNSVFLLKSSGNICALNCKLM